ncbi:MAG TPA: PD-(D/E)XK nuclease family protein, partial [Myxococcota bacterium]|nr:PD-(D/E)XK nuclease family protein [Myxococcota bacterium]
VEGARPRAPEDERGGRAVAPVRLDVAELDAAVAAAEAARRRLESWPASAPLATHLARFAELCTADLGWTDGEPARRVAGALETLATPPQLEHAFEEFTFVLRRVLAEETTLPIGGAGGGVQVLGATEARGRTFEHLFVAGLNRDAFPRVGSADPLLSDDVRGALAALLPEIPVKARGRSEERYMFAQLVAAAPRVTLSWQYAGDDGKARIVSPLLERLLGDRRETDIETAAAVLPLDDGAAPSDAPRTPRESAVLAGLRGGLHRDPDEHARRLELALAEELACGMAALPATATSDGCREVAAARARVVAAFEAGAFEPQRLAPWLGFLGERAADDARPDSTRGELFVTRFEAVATCPWRAVLERVLRLARAPDPLESLPAIESLALGSVVHGALQRIAETALGASGNSGGELDEVLRREPVPVSWPGAERLDALLLEFARRETAGRATGYPGLPRALAEYARPYVDRAGELLGWSSGNAVVLGAEVRGTAGVELPGGVHLDVPFAADLVERRGEDAVLTDYKTGKAKSAGALASTHLPRGEALQSTAYAVAAAAAGDDSAVGRYLYLGPDVDAAKAAVDAGPWRERLEAFTAALGAVTAAWSAGTCFPRLLDPLKDAEPQACAHCDVALACLVRDSGARRALATYTAPDGAAPGAMKDLWALAQRKDEGAGKRSGRRKGSA